MVDLWDPSSEVVALDDSDLESETVDDSSINSGRIHARVIVLSHTYLVWCLLRMPNHNLESAERLAHY